MNNLCSPSINEGPKKPRKKQNKKTTPREKEKEKAPVRTPLNPIFHYEELGSHLPTSSRQVKRYIVIFDVTRPETLIKAEEIIKNIHENTKNYKQKPLILLIANKLDLLADSKYPIDKSLIQGKIISLENECKYIAISLGSSPSSTIDPMENISSHAKKTLYAIVFLLSYSIKIINWKKTKNQLENLTTIFDDYWPVSQETNIVVTFSSSLSSTKSDRTKNYYGIIKGEFIFLISLDFPDDIRILYLPICSFSFDSTHKRSSILTISLPDKTSIEIKSQSLKYNLHQWEIFLNNRKSIFPNEEDSNISSTTSTTSNFSTLLSLNEKLENENLLDYFKRLENELTTTSVQSSLSYLYNLCSRSKCVDCEHCSCFYISRIYATLICSECIQTHIELNGTKQVIKSFDFSQAKQFKSFWSILGPNSNNYFNMLWERKKSTEYYKKINSRSNHKQRKYFIASKYSERLFYSAPTDVLYLKTTEGYSNRWEPRYLWVTPEGEIKIYEDSSHSKLIDSFHVSWCSFRSGVDLDLDPTYLHLIGPKSSDLFRTISAEIANCWIVILESCQLRVKKQPEISNPRSCPLRSSVACMEPSSITIANIRDLLLEKSHLVGIRKLKQQRLQVRQKLMEQLQETNFELEGLISSEEKSLAKIEDLEPMVIVRDLQDLQAILSSSCDPTLSHYYYNQINYNDAAITTTTTNNSISATNSPNSPTRSSSSSLKSSSDSSTQIEKNSSDHQTLTVPGHIRSGSANVLTPRFSQPNYENSMILKTLSEITQTTEAGISEFDADTGYIKTGTINRLLAALIDPFYCETEYKEIFLTTFPYVLQPTQFLKELAKRFAAAHIPKKKETKMIRNPETKHITLSISAQLPISDLEAIQITNNDSTNNLSQTSTKKGNKSPKKDKPTFSITEENNTTTHTGKHSRNISATNPSSSSSSSAAKKYLSFTHGSSSSKKISKEASKITTPSTSISSKETTTSSLNHVSQIRMNLLNIMEIWMSNYWPGDFSRNPELIVFMISFLDYIVQPMEGFKFKADCLRNLLQEQYRQYNTVTIPITRKVRAVSTSASSLGQFILDVDPLDIAKHLCLQNQELYKKIQARELLDKAWTRSDRLETSHHVVELTELFNRITAWASTCIVLQTKLKTRVKILDRFIHIALHCKELNNFHSLVALIGALRDPGVNRCRKTWRALPLKLQNLFEDLVNIISIQGNWMTYRELLTLATKNSSPCVPYIGVFLKDLVFVEDGIPAYTSETEQIINFEKHRKIHKIIRRLCDFQDIPYTFIPVPAISATLDLSLNVYPLLNEQERYEHSLEIEPKKDSKKSSRS